jgi:hypothetical protein
VPSCWITAEEGAGVTQAQIQGKRTITIDHCQSANLTTHDRTLYNYPCIIYATTSSTTADKAPTLLVKGTGTGPHQKQGKIEIIIQMMLFLFVVAQHPHVSDAAVSR